MTDTIDESFARTELDGADPSEVAVDDNDPAEVEHRTIDRGKAFAASVTDGWFTSGPRTEWARRVTRGRILNQDRIRPFTTRGVLLVGLGACLTVVHATAWALGWLAVGAIQCLLEIILEPTVRHKYEAMTLGTPTGRSWGDTLLFRVRRPLAKVWYLNHENSITNVTGVIGLFACIGNILAVLYGTNSSADPAWIRFLAFALAMLILVSGALGPLADTTMYSPRSKLPTWLSAVLRWLWVPVVGLIVALLLGAEGTSGAWGTTLPYAVMTTIGMGYYPMLRCREYERAMAAGEHVADDLAQDRYAAIALGLHNMLQPVKSTLQKAIDALPDPFDRLELTAYRDDVEYTYKAARTRTIDLSQGLGMPLDMHLQAIAERQWMVLEADLKLPNKLEPKEAARVKLWLLVLVHNSVQAYQGWDGELRPWIRATAYVDREDVVLEVSDLMGLIPETTWNNTKGTLGLVRTDIEALGGFLAQRPSPDGKTVTMRWPVVCRLVVPLSKEKK